MAKAKTAKRARKSAKTRNTKRAPKKSSVRPAKKVSRKTARKATKKTTKKTAKPGKLSVYKLAEDAPKSRYFVLANGKPVKHVAQLAEVLEDLEDHVFHHHVNPERNDFHNWVKDVFKDLELAKKMLGVDNKRHLQLVIYKHAAHKAFAHKG